MSGFKLGGLKKNNKLKRAGKRTNILGCPGRQCESESSSHIWLTAAAADAASHTLPQDVSHATSSSLLYLLLSHNSRVCRVFELRPKKKRNLPRPVTGIENETQQPLSRLIILSLFLAHNKAQYLVMVGCFGSDMRSAIFHLGCDYTRHFSLRGELMTMPPGSTLFFLSLSLSLQQEVVSAPFTHQSVRRAHGLRSAAHSTLFTQPPTALSPQVSPSACIWCISVCCTIAKQVLFCIRVVTGGVPVSLFLCLFSIALKKVIETTFFC